MNVLAGGFTERERELGAIISAYNEVTEQLKRSHDKLAGEVGRLREELARKNEELRRRERLAALGEMAAGVAHEIRNPLSGIQLFASLLERDLQDRPAELRLVEKITRCVNTQEAIVADILEFGRPAEPDPARVRLEDLIGQTVDLASTTIRQSGVAVEVSPHLAGIELVTDARLLQRALLNLLINALEATASVETDAQTGRVVVDGTGGPGERVSIMVQDAGPGIPPALMDRIFNPFFTTKDNGTGLGLAIVHQIAETLGGTVRAANREEGGAVFSLYLPRGSAVAQVENDESVPRRGADRVGAGNAGREAARGRENVRTCERENVKTRERRESDARERSRRRSP